MIWYHDLLEDLLTVDEKSQVFWSENIVFSKMISAIA